MLRDLDFSADVSELDWMALTSAADLAGYRSPSNYILRVAMGHPELQDKPDMVEAAAGLAVEQAHQDLRQSLGAEGYAAAIRVAESFLPREDEVRAFYQKWNSGVQTASV